MAAVREETLLERRIRDEGPPSLVRPADEVHLDAAMLEVVEHLVRHDARAVLEAHELVHVRDVEVAHSGVADLLAAQELVEAGHRLAQRYVPAPVEEVRSEERRVGKE